MEIAGRLAGRAAAAAGVALLVAACVAGAPSKARACSFAAPDPAEADPEEAAVDRVPPGPAGRPTVDVKRGHGAQSDGCGRLGTDSCADVGVLRLELDVAPDDRTAPEAMAYRVERIEGDDPGLFWTAELAAGVRFQARDGGRAELWIPWIDGDTNAQEALDLVLRITPVDRAGNAGPPVDVEVRDPGSGGCASGPVNGSGLLPVALVALAALRRRLRRPAS